MTTPAPLRIFEHQLVAYRRLWRGTLVTTFAQPVLFMLAFGVGVGALINDNQAAARNIGDVSYLSFVAPGLLASACMVLASVESTWPVMAALKWGRQYHAMVAAPLSSRDIVHSHVLWLLFRLTISSSVVGLMLLFPADTRSPGLIGSIGAGILTGLAFGLPIAAWAVTLERENSFSGLQRFFITPMYLFAGAMFPIKQLPWLFRQLAYITPLYHGVTLSRDFALGRVGAADAGHALVLGAIAFGGYLVARRNYERRLSR
jgi:lipooligosaccharide transport system permease protein